jgi:hypothetical protein
MPRTATISPPSNSHTNGLFLRYGPQLSTQGPMVPHDVMLQSVDAGTTQGMHLSVGTDQGFSAAGGAGTSPWCAL